MIGVEMPAYVICHVQQQNAPRGDKARELLSHRIAGLWNGTLQFDGTWIVEEQKTSDEIRYKLVDCLHRVNVLRPWREMGSW